VYIHPWELDPGQPRLNGSWKSRFRHYTGIGRMAARLEKLLANYRFAPLGDLVAQMQTLVR